jgi:hypothetical protein
MEPETPRKHRRKKLRNSYLPDPGTNRGLQKNFPVEEGVNPADTNPHLIR